MSCNIPILDFYLTECEMPFDTQAGYAGCNILQMACYMKRAKEANVLRLVEWLVEREHAHTGWEAAAGVALQNGMETVAAYLTYGNT